jgi:hypothetical protein
LNKLLVNFDNAGIITVLNTPGIISDKWFAICMSNKMTWLSRFFDSQVS